jgi:hypothetical protein
LSVAQVAVVREASDVMVKEVPPPLRGAKPSTLAAAVEVAAADVVVKEEAAPLRGAKPSTLAKAMEVPDEVAGEPPAADVAAKPSAVVAADEAVTDASSGKELRCV